VNTGHFTFNTFFAKTSVIGRHLKALDVKVIDEDRAKVDSIVPKGGMVSPYYEADFGPNVRW
jgi:hypothetical protein